MNSNGHAHSVTDPSLGLFARALGKVPDHLPPDRLPVSSQPVAVFFQIVNWTNQPPPPPAAIPDPVAKRMGSPGVESTADDLFGSAFDDALETPVAPGSDAMGFAQAAEEPAPDYPFIVGNQPTGMFLAQVFNWRNEHRPDMPRTSRRNREAVVKFEKHPLSVDTFMSTFKWD